MKFPCSRTVGRNSAEHTIFCSCISRTKPMKSLWSCPTCLKVFGSPGGGRHRDLLVLEQSVDGGALANIRVANLRAED